MGEVALALRLHAANGITALRVAATPLFVLAVVERTRGGPAWPAVALYAVAAASDFADGRVARRWSAESRSGRLLDHFADIGFLVAALTTYAAIGAAPALVPLSVATSFAVYVASSWIGASATRLHLAGSRVGHLAGIANWVVTGILVFNETLALHWLPPPVLRAVYWLVPAYSAAAILTRLVPRNPP